MNKKIVITVMILLILSLSIGLTYSYFIKGGEQEEKNTFFTVGCLSITIYNESNAINLVDAVPISDVEGLKTNGYTFNIRNNCSLDTDYEINLETMNDPESKNALNPSFVRVALNSDTFDNIISNLNENKKTTNYINNSYDAYNLYKGTIKANATKSFRLREWIDYNATKEAANKEYKSSINIVAGTIKDITKMPEIKTRYEKDKLIGTITGEAIDVKYCKTNDNECTPNSEVAIQNSVVEVDWKIDNETSLCSKINDTGEIYCSEVIFDTEPPTNPEVRLENDKLYFEGSTDNEGEVRYFYSVNCTEEYIEGTELTITEGGKVCVYAEDGVGNKSGIVEKQLNVIAAVTKETPTKYYCSDTGRYQDAQRCPKTEQKVYTETYTQACTTKTTTTYDWSTSTTRSSSCQNKDASCTSAYDVGNTDVTCNYVSDSGYEWDTDTYYNQSSCSSKSASCNSYSDVGNQKVTCSGGSKTTYKFGSASTQSGLSSCSPSSASCNSASDVGKQDITCSSSGSATYGWGNSSTKYAQSSCSSNNISCDASHVGQTNVSCSSYAEVHWVETKSDLVSSCSRKSASCSTGSHAGNTKVECGVDPGSPAYSTETTYTCQKTGSYKYDVTSKTCQQKGSGTTWTKTTKTCTSDTSTSYTETVSTCRSYDDSYYRKTTKTCEANTSSVKTYDSKAISNRSGGCSTNSPGCVVTSTNCSSTGSTCSSSKTCSGSCTATCDISYDGAKKYYCDITKTYHDNEADAKTACSNYCATGTFYNGKCYSMN